VLPLFVVQHSPRPADREAEPFIALRHENPPAGEYVAWTLLEGEEIMAKTIGFTVNGASRSLRVDDPEMPLLWALRENLGLTGTKFGCGAALCGACVVLVDGEPTRACITKVEQVAGKKITTIEGLSKSRSHPVQKAWIAEQVPQCGYCQSGQILSAAALLAKNSNPSDADIDQAMAGHICTCGAYNRIRKAIHTAATMMRKGA
jgi:aerobic-type carbon monoxide dehydrogenase small subunit (CoxS/CutS family)